MNRTKAHSHPRKMRMSDPGLPATISRAAMELDHASRGEKVKWEAMPRFAAFLNESLEQPITSSGRTTGWLDVNTADVMGDALIQFEGRTNLRTVKDVWEHARKIVAEMESASVLPKNSEIAELQRLRRFCVAFGNSLLTHRSSMEQEMPINPYRR